MRVRILRGKIRRYLAARETVYFIPWQRSGVRSAGALFGLGPHSRGWSERWERAEAEYEKFHRERIAQSDRRPSDFDEAVKQIETKKRKKA